jgi:hypothetical protein
LIDLTIKNSEQKQELAEINRVKQIIDETSKQLDEMHTLNIPTTEDVVQALEAANLNHIKIPAVFGRDADIEGRTKIGGFKVNYMNAVVHKRDNGQLVFMTMQSSMPTLDKMFEKTLRSNVANLSDVAFISGGVYSNGKTALEDIITEDSGSLHCLSIEHPQF